MEVNPCKQARAIKEFGLTVYYRSGWSSANLGWLIMKC